MDYPTNQAQMACIQLHLLLHLVPCIYIYKSDGPPNPLVLSHEVTTTPTATSSIMHIYRSQMDPPGTVTWSDQYQI